MSTPEFDLLAIDVGNTRAKGAWFAEGRLLKSEAWATSDLVRIFASEVPARVIASNVAGPHAGAHLMEQCALSGAALHIIRSQAAQCGVTSGYREPAQLGTDRWAALIGARAARDGACLVVVAGTATTIDALDPAGQFLGGLIIPGLALMRDSLARGTAQLPPDAGAAVDFPASTIEAINSGVLDATLGAIGRMRSRLADAAGALSVDEVPVLLSGGAAPWIAPGLTGDVEVREHLVLEGLARIANEVFA